MADTSAWINSRTSFSWYLYGLGNVFTPTYYMKAAIFNQPFTDGQASQPAGLISYVTPTAGYSSRQTPTDTVNGSISAGNVYNLYGGAQADDSKWYIAYSGSIELQPPAYYEWDSPKTVGHDLLLFANEWNRLTGNINAVRNMRGLSGYSFGSAYTGSPIYADGNYGYNYLRDAIWTMGASVPDPVTAGTTTISAAHLNALRDGINSIP